jgi:hypothetical protein
VKGVDAKPGTVWVKPGLFGRVRHLKGEEKLASSLSASKAIFAFTPASIFRLVFFVMSAPLAKQRQTIQLSLWSQNPGPLHPVAALFNCVVPGLLGTTDDRLLFDDT